MRRVLTLLSYDGTNYNGWQNQRDGNTIQSEFEKALAKICKTRIISIASGRTDSGVHAFAQPVHFDFPIDKMGLKNIQLALYSLLPSDIRPIKIYSVPKDFHARYWAISKTYRYEITTRPTPFNRLYKTFFKRLDIDYGKLCTLADVFVGKHNFSAFCKPSKDLNNYICNVNWTTFKQNGVDWIFEINANRFLHHMVRRIVGSLLSCQRQGLSKADLNDFLEGKVKNQKIAFTAPANGLFLKEVFYPTPLKNPSTGQ